MLETRSVLTGSFELIKKRNVLAFFFSVVFSVGMTFLLSDPSFMKIQNHVLFLLFLAISLWLSLIHI